MELLKNIKLVLKPALQLKQKIENLKRSDEEYEVLIPHLLIHLEEITSTAMKSISQNI